MRQKFFGYAAAIGEYILRKVLIYDLGVFVLVCLSFLIWGGFSAVALSERLVWTGIAICLVSGVLIFAQTSGGRDFGVPGAFMNSAHASVLHEWNIEIRKDIDRRFDFRFQIFLVGLVAFLIGVLIQIIFD
jgi:hypothetical protein